MIQARRQHFVFLFFRCLFVDRNGTVSVCVLCPFINLSLVKSFKPFVGKKFLLLLLCQLWVRQSYWCLRGASMFARQLLQGLGCQTNLDHVDGPCLAKFSVKCRTNKQTNKEIIGIEKQSNGSDSLRSDTESRKKFQSCHYVKSILG